MAKVTITLEDIGDGNINMSFESDPAFPGPAASEEEQNNITPAQSAAIIVLEFLASQHKDVGKEETNTSSI